MSETPPAGAVARLAAWRRTRPRTPPLTRHTVVVRGLPFAVWSTPAVPGAAPLLAINGGMIYGHDLLWPALAPLAEGRQVFLYDQRGRGETPAPPGKRAARIEHDILDIVALREALGIAGWDLVGHSWGGGMALLAAAEDPTSVRRVVTFDAVGATSRWLDALHDRALAHLAARVRDHRGTRLGRGARQRVLGAVDQQHGGTDRREAVPPLEALAPQTRHHRGAVRAVRLRWRLCEHRGIVEPSRIHRPAVDGVPRGFGIAGWDLVGHSWGGGM
ncbi:MAG: alpha/beta fold hydrolase, partial [Gemmatimonadota bacterium]